MQNMVCSVFSIKGINQEKKCQVPLNVIVHECGGSNARDASDYMQISFVSVSQGPHECMLCHACVQVDLIK